MSDAAHVAALFSVGATAVDRCEIMARPNMTNIVASLFILIGLLVSYLPQHWRIYSRGTAEGISPYFVLLGTTSATAGFANILTTEPSRQDIACCKLVGPLDCAFGLLGIAQLGVQWMCFIAIMVLYLVYFRAASPDQPSDAEVEAETEAEIDPKTSRTTALLVGTVCVLHAVVIVAVTVVLSLSHPDSLNNWADFLGVMAAMLAAVQYLPQIWTTWRIKHVGSLSIPMMCIQTPGGVVFAISLYSRLGLRGWSTWGIFVLSALMQGSLLAMAMYFEIARENAEAAANRRAAARSARRAARGAQGSLSVPKRPGTFRTYSEAYDDTLPGPYTAHPESYAETPDELDRLWYREERQINNETRPLLAPGGIGNPHRSYSSRSINEPQQTPHARFSSRHSGSRKKGSGGSSSAGKTKESGSSSSKKSKSSNKDKSSKK
ncbi:hypothetical protein TD95_004162 [Thielaviopsis punctulata]|uniref:PQ loop repeat protein n=1 Tax=Thielaviopsis punctulata TaxID=72032 RepID=A0A0F4ZE58_9PEZI|nr:hypothetical protein TD95_004162 [Thielaviopsis punctulata]